MGMKRNGRWVAALTAISVFTIVSGGTLAQGAPPAPGSPGYISRSTDILLGLANTRTQEGAIGGIHAALERSRANMQAFAEDGDTGALNAESDAFGTLISGMAKQVATGGDEALQQLVAAATQHHINKLEELKETLPEQAQAGIDRALSQSNRGQQAALAALRGERLPAGFGRPSGVGGGPPSGIGGFGRGGGIGGGPPGGFGGGPPGGFGGGPPGRR